MRITRWAQKFNLKVIPCENRPDHPQGDTVYRIVDIFTTRDSSWELSDAPGSLEQWARDAYLKPTGADDYFDEAGADHHLFALVLDETGRPIKTPGLVRFWSDGLNQLANPAYTAYRRETPKERSGWALIDVWGESAYNYKTGARGPWSWCPEGASDVITGGGMPLKWHVSTFVVWKRERSVAVMPPVSPAKPPLPFKPPTPITPITTLPDVTPEQPLAEPSNAEQLRREAWSNTGIAYKPDSPLSRYARAHNLGAPMTAEFTSHGFRMQGFALGIVYAPVEQPEQTSHIDWYGDLKAMPGPESPPETKIAFTATPDHISAGQSALLQWTVSAAEAVFIDGEGVDDQGTRQVSPAATTTYRLLSTAADGSTSEAEVTVTVEVRSTRAATVTLAADNIARLRTFPRPLDDNGRGLHFRIGITDESIAWSVERLKSIDAKWTLVYAQDELQAESAAGACWRAGIMPVTRIGKKVDEFFDPLPYVAALKRVGAPPYIQIYNEPSDSREWRKDETPEDYLQVFGRNWAQQAAHVADAGGYPGIQVLEKVELDAAIDAVAANGRTDIWQKAWFCTHNYGANHPPAYPYDIGQTVFDDFYGVLSFLAFAKWMQDRIGFVLPIIGGEGGWQYGQDQDRRYPKVDNAGATKYHAQYHRELFDWFRTGLLSNGEPLPDYLFSVTPWIAGGWGADDWWGGVLGTKTDTVDAVAAIPKFVRRFSWDG